MQNHRARMFGLLALLWIGVLFFFSGQNGEDSQRLSLEIVHRLFSFLMERGVSEETLNFLVRKAAHMFIFAVEAGFLSLWLTRVRPNLPKAMAAVLICFLLACANEYHQSFSGGRSALFSDVLYDTVGACLGAAAAVLLSAVTNRRGQVQD